MLTLRRLLTLGFSLLALLPLVTGGVVTWYLLMPELQEQSLENSTLLANTLVGQVHHFIEMPQELLYSGANVLRGSNPSANPSDTQVNDALNLITRANKVFSATYLTDQQYRITHLVLGSTAHIDRKDLLGLDLSAEKPFGGTRDPSHVRWGEVFFSAITAEPAIVAAIDLDRRTLAGEISLNHLSDLVHLAAVREGMQIVITDDWGQILAHSDPTVPRLTNFSHLELLQQVAAKKKVSGIFDFNGLRYVGTAIQIQPQNWVLIVAQPLETALQPGWHTLRMLGWIALAVLVFALGIGYLMARWLATRTEAVAHAAVQAAEQHEEVVWPTIVITEYNQLVESLRSLIQTVKLREQELREANLTLEDKVQRRTQALTQANAQLAQAVEDLTHARNNLDRAERLAALGRLVAGMAHELNTPIGNCLMVASALHDTSTRFMAIPLQNLRRDTLQEYQSQNLEASTILMRNLERAAQLVQSFKQVATDQRSAQRRKFDLATEINELRISTHPMLNSHHITLEVNIPDGIGMDSYPDLVYQVINNLLENAVLHAYRNHAGGIIQIHGRQKDAENVELSVRDFGCGIAADQLSKIFEPFYKPQFGQGEGTGLGLHISHQIVKDLLGGTLHVESTETEGSCFTLILPCHAPAMPE